ncbi:TetR family transcriptional regulator [Mumia zhuanghuii]|uniref:TetR/AcrR family transcriptional regulator n=1 Tax=Mumia zhuanghuii TaxID=2585211 RepID=A0A5C4MH20_9ACTN|nr:TetR family transcriptional regulator [Mumia zhuanghuii]TNC41014.1 TetR/AcrR family transcriptional regulator [Mumia zhuanghuii]TNC49242.1 TetR/AcrR family transcriptional regulator [Mumia zhuanghuii]
MAGRRPGTPDTRGEIVAAARAELAQRGYDGTSIRAVARRAGVDPALVHHYFKDKQRLVAAALQLPNAVGEVMAPVLDAAYEDVGRTFVHTLLASWDDPANREAVIAAARSGLGSSEQGLLARDFVLNGQIAAVLERHCPDAPPVTSALLLMEMVGLLTSRYLLDVEPLASMPVDSVAALLGPTVQRYLALEASSEPAGA